MSLQTCFPRFGLAAKEKDGCDPVRQPMKNGQGRTILSALFERSDFHEQAELERAILEKATAYFAKGAP